MRLAFPIGVRQDNGVMKTLGSKLGLVVGAVALGFVLAAPLVRAANDKGGPGPGSGPGGPGPGGKSGGGERPRPDEDTLRRYDRNGNGKLDPDEEAAMKADQQRAKNNEKKKKG